VITFFGPTVVILEKCAVAVVSVLPGVTRELVNLACLPGSLQALPQPVLQCVQANEDGVSRCKNLRTLAIPRSMPRELRCIHEEKAQAGTTHWARRRLVLRRTQPHRPAYRHRESSATVRQVAQVLW
jgi:hypothetical protein